MPKLIDLTRQLRIQEKLPPFAQPLVRILNPGIEYVSHQQGAKIMEQIFGCQSSDLPECEGWAEENLILSSHLGTHVDAPWHWGSRCLGEKALTVENIPLEELFCDGVVLDLTSKNNTGAAIEVSDLVEALERIPYQIRQGDAVLLRTGHDKYDLSDPRYYNYPGLIGESALYLAKSGARVGGTDALGWDRPFLKMVADFQRTRNKDLIWDAHYALRNYRFYVVQQLANLDKLPSCGFKVGFFPLPLAGASAAPARVVAFL